MNKNREKGKKYPAMGVSRGTQPGTISKNIEQCSYHTVPYAEKKVAQYSTVDFSLMKSIDLSMNYEEERLSDIELIRSQLGIC